MTLFLLPTFEQSENQIIVFRLHTAELRKQVIHSDVIIAAWVVLFTKEMTLDLTYGLKMAECWDVGYLQ